MTGWCCRVLFNSSPHWQVWNEVSPLLGSLMHNRIRPRKHRFKYQLALWLVDLDELSGLDKGLSLFSLNRFNWVSFHEQDYGDKSGNALKEQISSLLAKHRIEAPDSVQLLCSPRVLGFVFNPLSVYFCYRANQLSALVYEVSNTFGERHSYVIPVDNNQRAGAVHQSVRKALHVSPFFKMDCFYRFRMIPPGKNATVGIELVDDSGKLFAAVFQGARKELSNRVVVQQLLLLPWQTLKVVVAIHWEALRLWLKGIAIVRHKPAPEPYDNSPGSNKTIKGSQL